MAIELIAIAELGPLKGVFQIPYLSRRITFSYDFSYVALTGRQPTESVTASTCFVRTKQVATTAVNVT